jgi:hypothetical protein
MTLLTRVRLRRRPIVRPEDLSLTYAGVTLLYPPLPRFRGNELPDFYSDVCKRHQFDSFSLLGDSGARLETEAERKLAIEREEFSYEEHVRNIRDAFPMVKNRTVDLVSDAAQHFGLRFFLPQDCTMRAVWPVPQEIGDVEAELRDKAFNIRSDQFDHLGEVSGVGMHLTGHRGEAKDFGWSLEVAPYLPEEGNLFIEVSSHIHSPLQTADEVGDFLQDTYDFLTEDVVAFVNAFL